MAAKKLEPLKRRVLFLSTQPLNAGNRVVLVDTQAAMPHAFAPALPGGNDWVGVNGIFLVVVAVVVLTVSVDRNSHRLKLFLALKRNGVEFLIELINEPLENRPC